MDVIYKFIQVIKLGLHLQSECCVLFVARQCRQIRLCLPGWAVSGGWGWAEFRVSLMTETGQEPQLNV